MSWSKTLNEFKAKFKGYDVRVIPPCISVNREGQYVYEAMECALGKRLSPFVTIDHDKKEVVYKR